MQYKQARRYRSLPLAMGENAFLPALEESIIKKDLIFAFGFFFLFFSFITYAQQQVLHTCLLYRKMFRPVDFLFGTSLRLLFFWRAFILTEWHGIEIKTFAKLICTSTISFYLYYVYMSTNFFWPALRFIKSSSEWFSFITLDF